MSVIERVFSLIPASYLAKINSLSYYRQQPNAFPLPYLNDLRGEILACPYFTVNQSGEGNFGLGEEGDRRHRQGFQFD